jgi:hypothetical protein
MKRPVRGVRHTPERTRRHSRCGRLHRLSARSRPGRPGESQPQGDACPFRLAIAVARGRPDNALARRPERARRGRPLRRSHSGESGRVPSCFPRVARLSAPAPRCPSDNERRAWPGVARVERSHFSRRVRTWNRHRRRRLADVCRSHRWHVKHDPSPKARSARTPPPGRGNTAGRVFDGQVSRAAGSACRPGWSRCSLSRWRDLTPSLRNALRRW